MSAPRQASTTGIPEISPVEEWLKMSGTGLPFRRTCHFWTTFSTTSRKGCKYAAGDSVSVIGRPAAQLSNLQPPPRTSILVPNLIFHPPFGPLSGRARLMRKGIIYIEMIYEFIIINNVWLKCKPLQPYDSNVNMFPRLQFEVVIRLSAHRPKLQKRVRHVASMSHKSSDLSAFGRLFARQGGSAMGA
ncbi:hypothetical protein C8Q76DRAFT_688037 [Earliella scabrosa]|nr:hypothetical protein C8Q76DRAFT_688037 [Earliella scabrosa]